MKLNILPMTQPEAKEIAANWHYDGVYAFYDRDVNTHEFAQFLSVQSRRDDYFSVFADGELIGFFSFKENEKSIVDMDCGMKPSWTGKGWGIQFMPFGIDFIVKRSHPSVIRVDLPLFNHRALSLVRRLGFEPVHEYSHQVDKHPYTFLQMVYWVRGDETSYHKEFK